MTGREGLTGGGGGSRVTVGRRAPGVAHGQEPLFAPVDPVEGRGSMPPWPPAHYEAGSRFRTVPSVARNR